MLRVGQGGRGWCSRESTESLAAGRRLVEAGRLCLVNFGPLCGKTVIIINVMDGKSCLIDGPSTVNSVVRQVMPLKRLQLTPFKIEIPAGARLSTLLKAYKASGVEKSWIESSWAKGMARKQAKANLTDMGRFKLMVARKTRARAVNKVLKTMKKK
ncbi:ribosomal protein L14-domain-containing protein [Baffinella frigidus]|nr:ribosomal protein L14-domain-containing protein [Cryptophyta sp. CCMP2293]